jgi:hypothetical protein
VVFSLDSGQMDKLTAGQMDIRTLVGCVLPLFFLSELLSPELQTRWGMM